MSSILYYMNTNNNNLLPIKITMKRFLYTIYLLTGLLITYAIYTIDIWWIILWLCMTIVFILDYLDKNNIEIEDSYIWKPTHPEIIINPTKYKWNKYFAWTDGINWFYNYNAAMLEVKHLWKRIPTDKEWNIILRKERNIIKLECAWAFTENGFENKELFACVRSSDKHHDLMAKAKFICYDEKEDDEDEFTYDITNDSYNRTVTWLSVMCIIDTY